MTVKELKLELEEKDAVIRTLSKSLLLFMEYARRTGGMTGYSFTALENSGTLTERGSITIQYEDELSGFTFYGDENKPHTIVNIPRDSIKLTNLK